MSSLNISIELKDTLSMLSSEKKNFEIFKDLIKKCDNVEAEDIEYKDVENKDVQYKDENTQTLSSDIIKKASKSVHADCTLADYKEYNNHSIINVYIINVYIYRQWNLFKKFIQTNYFNFNAATEKFTKDTSLLICLWIYQACESSDALITHASSLNTVKTKIKEYIFSHACKMRSACSWYYAFQQQRDNNAWQHQKDEIYTGNSFISAEISHYMKSLQRRKINF